MTALSDRLDPDRLRGRLEERATRRAELLEQREAIDEELRQLDADDSSDRELTPDDLRRWHGLGLRLGLM